jgi:hypothetical protein
MRMRRRRRGRRGIRWRSRGRDKGGGWNYVALYYRGAKVEERLWSNIQGRRFLRQVIWKCIRGSREWCELCVGTAFPQWGVWKVVTMDQESTDQGLRRECRAESAKARVFRKGGFCRDVRSAEDLSRLRFSCVLVITTVLYGSRARCELRAGPHSTFQHEVLQERGFRRDVNSMHHLSSQVVPA